MPKRLNKPILVRIRDENGNYITLNMSTGSRKTNYQTKQSTSINKPRRKQNVNRTLKPGEQVFTDWRTGKKTVFTPKRTEVKSDNRSEYQKEKDQKTADILHQKYSQQKTTEEGLKNLEAIGKVISPSTYVGPLVNKIAASVQGDKKDSRSIGEQILSGEGTGDTAGNLLLDFASPYAFSKLPNAIKQLYKATRYVNNKVLDNLGSAAIYANGLGFDRTVGKSFFRDPNKAYRITEYPEVQGIREVGKNVTTRDANFKIRVPANEWRLSAFDNYAYSKDGSWYKLPKSVSSYEEENPLSFVDIGNTSDPVQVRLATKTGSAHGNRSQASLGKPWEGGLSTSGGLFPRGILEIQGGNKIAVGKDRVHFSLKDWEDALVGSRVGYKTGEMPLDNLTWYQRLPNGRYTMGEPVLPDKTIQIKPSTKQQRLQLEKPTWQIYPGKTHKISEVIDDSGNVNLANLLKIQNEALSNVPGGRLARHRLENPDWHKTDWNTFLHSRDAYQRALQAGYPNEALFPTLMHDAGKLWAGDGHGPYGASIVNQIFPDATDEQIMAIYQHMDKVPESTIGKLVKGADIKEPNQFRTFKSELDWSPQSWFSKRADKKWTKQDEDALVSHLQEYLDIEKKSKQNGTWLKNKDGSTFDGDPRSWVQMQSDSFKKSYNDEILTHGEDAVNDLFGDFYGDGVGTGIGDKVLWTSTNKLLGKTYGNDVFSLAALKNAKTNIVADAEGRPWINVVQGKDTNNLVYPNLTNDNIVRINNVVDAGPNIKWSEIKDFRKNETVPEYLSRKYTGDDVVIGQDVSRKSIVGNNGDFNPIDKNIYRALIPLIGTYGLYDINKYNYNSGKDIHIKPSKRGTFTKAAKQHGMSVQSFANRVLRNPSKYSAAIRKKANFARNASKWNK